MGSLKKKNYKINVSKRRFCALAFLLVCFLIGIVVFLPKSYQNEYVVDGIKVLEQYDKKRNSYFFTFETDQFQYITTFQKDYTRKKQQVLGIELFTEQDETCLKIKSDTLYFTPLCERKKEQITYHLASEAMKAHFDEEYFPSAPKVSLKNEKLEVFSTLSHTYYIYNYKGFYKVQDQGITSISLFSKDVYDAPLITQVNDFLVIPDYEQNFYFQKVYFLNMQTGEVIPVEFKESIYFDSVILGAYENSLYLLDKHEKIEWKLDVKKRSLEKVSHGELGKIYQEEWKEKSINRILEDHDTFQYSKNISYFSKEGIYANILDKRILVSSLKPKKIVFEFGDEVFYIVDDSFYAYSNYYGETLLMKSFEWNFNYKNMIFVSH